MDRRTDSPARQKLLQFIPSVSLNNKSVINSLFSVLFDRNPDLRLFPQLLLVEQGIFTTSIGPVF